MTDPIDEPAEVVAVNPLGGLIAELTFKDGAVRIVNLSSLLDGPVFELIRDPGYFRTVSVDPDLGTVVWPNGADLDPDVLRNLPEQSGFIDLQAIATLIRGQFDAAMVNAAASRGRVQYRVLELSRKALYKSVAEQVHVSLQNASSKELIAFTIEVGRETSRVPSELSREVSVGVPSGLTDSRTH